MHLIALNACSAASTDLSRCFIQGLFAVLPLCLTSYLLHSYQISSVNIYFDTFVRSLPIDLYNYTEHLIALFYIQLSQRLSHYNVHNKLLSVSFDRHT